VTVAVRYRGGVYFTLVFGGAVLLLGGAVLNAVHGPVVGALFLGAARERYRRTACACSLTGAPMADCRGRCGCARGSLVALRWCQRLASKPFALSRSRISLALNRR
jgi:hypothetical protein